MCSRPFAHIGILCSISGIQKNPRSVVACARVCFIIQCVVRCGGLHNAGTLATGLLKQGDRLSSTIRNLETVRVLSALRREVKWNKITFDYGFGHVCLVDAQAMLLNDILLQEAPI